MAGFAIHVRVLAIFLLVRDVRVAALASLMPGEIHRSGGNFCQGGAAIVSIFPKTLGDQKAPDDQKQEGTRGKDRG